MSDGLTPSLSGPGDPRRAAEAAPGSVNLDAYPGPELREECGIFGAFAVDHAPVLAYYGLYALQHRGQESAGIAYVTERGVESLKGMGLVGEVFDMAEVSSWRSAAAIGHVRYPTFGSSNYANAQPLVVQIRQGPLALGHNGQLVNAVALRLALEEEGAIFQTDSDSEVIAHLIARAKAKDMRAAFAEALPRLSGSYALVALTNAALFGARDPNGIRPLSLGRLNGGWLLASETCAFDACGAEFVRDIEPGEMVTITADGGLESYRFAPAGQPALCSFEYIYFARPDSDIQGKNVHMVRKELGRRLARDFPVDADIVVGVPDSSTSAAIGYAEEAGLPNEIGLIKNRYIARTFIQPTQAGREFAVRLKLNPLRRVVDGQRVVLVDDSIVRGTTSKHIVRLLRGAGAREVHLRITSPPYRCPCYYGIDTSSSAELIAASHDVEAICRAVGADSLAYQTVEGLEAALGYEPDQTCLACFLGNYVVAAPGRGPRLPALDQRRSVAFVAGAHEEEGR